MYSVSTHNCGDFGHVFKNGEFLGYVKYKYHEEGFSEFLMYSSPKGVYMFIHWYCPLKHSDSCNEWYSLPPVKIVAYLKNIKNLYKNWSLFNLNESFANIVDTIHSIKNSSILEVLADKCNVYEIGDNEYYCVECNCGVKNVIYYDHKKKYYCLDDEYPYSSTVNG